VEVKVPKQIVGSVYWIEDGNQTGKVVDAQEAFSDPAQAVAQIQYAEHSGDKQHLKLSRLAYRQFLGKRYRGESKSMPQRATGEVDLERISKPPRKKPSKAKPSRGPVVREVTRNAPEVPSKSPRSERSKAKSSKKVVIRKVARNAAKVTTKFPGKERSKIKSPREPSGKKAARITAKVAYKSPRSEPSRPSKKTVERKVERKVTKVAAPPSRKKVSRAMSSKKPTGKKAARKVSARKATKRKASNK
jgi:hypothetical protein